MKQKLECPKLFHWNVGDTLTYKAVLSGKISEVYPNLVVVHWCRTNYHCYYASQLQKYIDIGDIEFIHEEPKDQTKVP